MIESADTLKRQLQEEKIMSIEKALIKELEKGKYKVINVGVFTDEKPAEDAETFHDAEMKAILKAIKKDLEKNGKVLTL